MVRARYAMQDGRGLSIVPHRMLFFCQETSEIIKFKESCWT